jgi:hypothetical protein
MPSSHAAEIVVDFLESEDWADFVDAEAEPELDLPPLPPPAPRPQQRPHGLVTETFPVAVDLVPEASLCETETVNVPVEL